MFVVDAFTVEPFSGNPAAVVLDAGNLSSRAMQRIAREMNLSETAFLLPATVPDADLRVRWFSPTVEVRLCGHATVATFHAAMETGRLAAGAYRMESRSGILPIGLGREGDRPLVSMDLPVPRAMPLGGSAGELHAALRLAKEAIDTSLPSMKVADWGIVPVRSLAALKDIRPDFVALCDLDRASGIGNTIVLSTQTVEETSAVHLRMFAPAYGIEEDPVTGSAQAPVAVYLAAAGRIRPGPVRGSHRSATYQAEQGDLIGRPGRVDVTVGMDRDRVSSVRIQGRAVTVLRGTVRIDQLTSRPRSARTDRSIRERSPRSDC